MQKHYFFNLKLPGALKSSIFWKIRTFSIPQAVFFVGGVQLDFSQACDEVQAQSLEIQVLSGRQKMILWSKITKQALKLKIS